MIARAETTSFPLSTLRRLMRDRSLDSEQKTVMVGLLMGLADDGGIIEIAEDELRSRFSMDRRQLRRSLAELWVGDYINELAFEHGILTIAIKREA